MAKITFLVKDCSNEEILQVLGIFRERLVVRNENGDEINTKKFERTFKIILGRVVFVRSQNSFTFNEKEITFTTNEKKILSWFFHNPSKVASRDMLLAITYGPGSANNDRTIDSHIKKIRQKIKGAGAHELHFMLKTAYGEGYKLDPKAKK